MEHLLMKWQIAFVLLLPEYQLWSHRIGKPTPEIMEDIRYEYTHIVDRTAWRHKEAPDISRQFWRKTCFTCQICITRYFWQSMTTSSTDRSSTVKNIPLQQLLIGQALLHIHRNHIVSLLIYCSAMLMSNGSFVLRSLRVKM